MEKKLVGRVIHFYPKISVAVIELSDDLKVGDKILIEGKSEPVHQTVSSMQIEHAGIEHARAGQSIGMKTEGHVKEGDHVYKVTE
jgi:putative protease